MFVFFAKGSVVVELGALPEVALSLAVALLSLSSAHETCDVSAFDVLPPRELFWLLFAPVDDELLLRFSASRDSSADQSEVDFSGVVVGPSGAFFAAPVFLSPSLFFFSSVLSFLDFSFSFLSFLFPSPFLSFSLTVSFADFFVFPFASSFFAFVFPFFFELSSSLTSVGSVSVDDLDFLPDFFFRFVFGFDFILSFFFFFFFPFPGPPFSPCCPSRQRSQTLTFRTSLFRAPQGESVRHLRVAQGGGGSATHPDMIRSLGVLDRSDRHGGRGGAHGRPHGLHGVE